MEGIRDKLTLDMHREGSLKPHRSIMCAANEEDDSVFCLIEGKVEIARAEKGTASKSTFLEHMNHRWVRWVQYGIFEWT
jgi:hypothetical protein